MMTCFKFYFLTLAALGCFAGLDDFHSIGKVKSLSNGELDLVIGGDHVVIEGECFKKGEMECPETPTTTCRDVPCNPAVPPLIATCPVNTYVPANGRTSVDSCVSGGVDFLRSETDVNQPEVYCWKWSLCASSCTLLSNMQYYCDSGGQGGIMDCDVHPESCVTPSTCEGTPEKDDCKKDSLPEPL